MRKLAVVHRNHAEWVLALKEAEPRLDIRGFHPSEVDADEWLEDAEGLFVWKIPAGLMARMPRLTWIQCSGAGVDHLASDPAIPVEIPITRADGLFGFWMARYAVAHLLIGAQRMEECRQAQQAARWDAGLLPEDLTGKTALVFGFGRIGRQIGRALRELGLDVHGFVHEVRDDPEFPLHSSADLVRWLPSARILVLCAPLTRKTRGVVNSALLKQGNASLLLVNVGRGDLVVVPDLLDALDAGRLGLAVLDVFSEEPLPAKSPLWGHPKVVVTPHHSGPSTPRALVPDILTNLHRYAEGQPILDAVSRERGY
jgi:glyoxylate/hydroxypyruvate reductase A